MKCKSDILTTWGVCCEEDGNLDVLWKQVISAQAFLNTISANHTPLYDGPLQRGCVSIEKRSTIAVICRGAIEVEWLFISKYFIVFRINFFWEQKFLLKIPKTSPKTIFYEARSYLFSCLKYILKYKQVNIKFKCLTIYRRWMYETSGVSELYGGLRWSSLSDCPRSHSVTSSDDTSVKRWSQSQLTSSYQEEKRQTCWNVTMSPKALWTMPEQQREKLKDNCPDQGSLRFSWLEQEY